MHSLRVILISISEFRRVEGGNRKMSVQTRNTTDKLLI